MRPGPVEDRGLPLSLGQQFQHAANLGPGAAAGQLAVAEGPGASFAEQVVAVRIKRPTSVEGANIVNALAHGLATLQDEWLITLLGEEIRGHQPGRSGTDHDG